MPKLDEWIRDADAYMYKHYRITLSGDAGIERSELERAMIEGATPADFCEWVGNKYDLDSIEQMRLNWQM